MGTAESRPNCVQVYTGVSVQRGALCRGTGTKRSKFIYLISAPPVVCSACRLIKGRARPPALVVEVGGGGKARRTTDSNLCVIRALGTQSRIRFADYTKTTISRDAVAPLVCKKVTGIRAYYRRRQKTSKMSLADELLADLDDLGDELGDDENEKVCLL